MEKLNMRPCGKNYMPKEVITYTKSYFLKSSLLLKTLILIISFNIKICLTNLSKMALRFFTVTNINQHAWKAFFVSSRRNCRIFFLPRLLSVLRNSIHNPFGKKDSTIKC